jgi:hypothetical protein
MTRMTDDNPHARTAISGGTADALASLFYARVADASLFASAAGYRAVMSDTFPDTCG